MRPHRPERRLRRVVIHPYRPLGALVLTYSLLPLIIFVGIGLPSGLALGLYMMSLGFKLLLAEKEIWL